MILRDELRRHLFGVLMSLPPDKWPGDEENLLLLGFDSLRVMRLLVWIEEGLGIAIPDEEITPEGLSCVASLVELICRQTGATSPARL